MFCCSPDDDIQIKADKIIAQLYKLKQQVSSRIQQIKQDSFKKQKLLLKQFYKINKQRTLQTQLPLINGIVIEKNKILILEIYKLQLNKLIQNKAHFCVKKRAEKYLYPSFAILLYSQPFLHDQNISDFCKKIKELYSHLNQANDNQVEEIMRYHKKNTLPSQKMLNQYLLQLSNRQKLNLQKINQVGHNFHYS